ncbi:MAG: flagellar hook-associated protein FlgK [Solibacillus sp.]
MRSTFMGLEASKRGLFTQQSALYTTGHNISNANTQGYSRQRVNMETTEGYPGTGLNSAKSAGHIGTGVEAHSVQRIRDQFIDRQYRQETNKLGYWESKTKSISQMEDIMSEPSEFGLNQSFTEFWKSMEDVIDNPKDTAARQVMISKGEALADSFNYMDTQLKSIQGNIGNELLVSTDRVNSILNQIASLNKQIQSVEPNGYMPNDLYDTRDVLVDELNSYLPVSISKIPSGGNALAIAEGGLRISFKPTNGQEIVLVDGKDFVKIAALDTANKPVDGDVDNQVENGYFPFKEFAVSSLGEPPVDATNASPQKIQYDQLEKSKGQLLSLIDSYGHSDGKGLYPEMLANLDTLASVFVSQFNLVHQAGKDLEGVEGGKFFEGDSAKNMSVVLKDTNKIAASSQPGEVGNNENAHALSKLQTTVQGTLKDGTFQSFYKSLIGDLGVTGQEAIRLEFNSTTLRLQIENNRASQSSVSLDEEMTNMITFQQAYNANARMVTVIDEVLDKIINGMGRVGL